ncbi:MAG: hypothetical protein DWQ07_03245 [Chloroflexi bacterium]|nr:MAG: hypothetical protein DWQ07_03245 [Chloroflexota bacterium]MBL1193484.1 hypothetical protein [Chloroflexota bacterium]NOH10775.1 hypothetical protein [Chloroflexota bacterium]
MNNKAVKTISDKVYKRFPEVSGSRPQVKSHNGPQAKKAFSAPTYLLTYKGKGQGPGGKSIARQIRVVANADGKILKMSTSR